MTITGSPRPVPSETDEPSNQDRDAPAESPPRFARRRDPESVTAGESAREARERLSARVEEVFAADPPVTRADVGRARKSVSRETSTRPREGVSRETSGTSHVFAVANQKGGVGKTTTAVNLAACLAAAERRTLLVDLDPQGNATSGLGVDKEALAASMYDVLIEGRPLREIVRATDLELLDLAPATVDLFGAEIELVSEIGREHRLRAALEDVRGQYDFIVVDCPPSLGLLTVNALAGVDSILIPIQCEYYALEGLSQLLGTTRIVQKNLNPGLEIEGVLLTMYDPRLNLARQVQNEAVDYFGAKVYDTVIPRNVRLSEAPGFGQPVILYDIVSSGAESYMKLAEEVIERCRHRAESD